MNLRQIEAFKTVMITGSATKAAEVMCITQPAVSRLIADLEYHINFKLFERKPNRLLPTHEAKLFFLEVERAFIGLDIIKRSAEGIAEKQTGRLRIVAMPICIDSFLPKLIAGYLKMHSDVAIELEAVGRNEVVDLIESQQFDLGLAHLPTHQSSISLRRFTKHQAVCILPKHHHLSAKKTLHAKDFEGENFIALSNSSPFRTTIDEVFEQAGIRRKISVETRTQLAICNLVTAGAGISLVDPLIANSMGDEALDIRPFKPAISWSLALLAPSPNGMSLVAKDFSDWVCKYFTDLSPNWWTVS